MAKVTKPKPCPCKVCGRPLKNPTSIARGMGPTCERRVLGVVRGAEMVRRPRAKQAKGNWRQLSLFPENGGNENEQ